jgi:CRP/FNR family transcriptional regulator, cyclic AMP receptor protein
MAPAARPKGSRSQVTSDPDPMRVFGPVRARDVRSLASPVLEVIIPAGTTLMREGEEIGTFFVIRAGSVELSRGGTPVRALGPGDCFGESNAEEPHRQHFSAVAENEVKLLVFSSEGIARLCAAIPGARENILRYLPAPIYMLPPPERSRSAPASSTVMAR